MRMVLGRARSPRRRMIWSDGSECTVLVRNLMGQDPGPVELNPHRRRRILKRSKDPFQNKLLKALPDVLMLRHNVYRQLVVPVSNRSVLPFPGELRKKKKHSPQ